MKKRDFIERTKNSLIVFDSPEIEKRVMDWLEKNGMSIMDFLTILGNIGIKIPVILSKSEKVDPFMFRIGVGSFKCITEDNKEVIMCFKDEEHLLLLDEDKAELKYHISRDEEDDEILTELETKDIQRGKMELFNSYNPLFCSRILILDSEDEDDVTYLRELSIDIWEPSNRKDKSKILVLQNREKIEEYLLGLDEALDVFEVYHKMMELLKFSRKDILNSREISISYTITRNGKKEILGKILLENGREEMNQITV